MRSNNQLPRAITREHMKNLLYLAIIFLVAVITCIEVHSVPYLILIIAACIAAVILQHKRWLKAEKNKFEFVGTCIDSGSFIQGKMLKDLLGLNQKYIFEGNGKVLTLLLQSHVPFHKGKTYHLYLPEPESGDNDYMQVYGIYGYELVNKKKKQ